LTHLRKRKKKKEEFWAKKQAEAELKKKKTKIGGKFLKRVQKLPNFKEKKEFSGQKNKLGLSLSIKKRSLWVKNLGKKLRIRSRN